MSLSPLGAQASLPARLDNKLFDGAEQARTPALPGFSVEAERSSPSLLLILFSALAFQLRPLSTVTKLTELVQETDQIARLAGKRAKACAISRFLPFNFFAKFKIALR